MAYSNLETLYLNRQAEQVFPTLPEEPMGEEAVQLAAGPARTMSDAGGGMPSIKPLPQTTLERALEQTGLTLEQAGRFLDSLGQVDLPVLGKVSLADFVPFVGSAKEGSRSVMAPAEWQGAPKTLQQMGTGVGSMLDRVTTGTGMARQLNEDAKLAAMDVATNIVPVAKVTAKAATKTARALAPKAAEMAEQYLTKTGAILKAAPDAPAIEVPAAGDITKPAFKRWFGDSAVSDGQGQPMVVYHQTNNAAAENIMRDGFRTDKPFARQTDEQVPDGLFFKPTDANIGVGSINKDEITQIPVYLSLKNPLVVSDRSQITQAINDPEYARLSKFYDDLDKSLASEFDAKWYDKEFMKNDAAWDAFSEEWQKRVDTQLPAAAAEARARLTQVLRERGYDGMVIENDVGSANRSTKTYIALDPTQVKSVFNKGTWNPNDPRILHGAGGATAAGAAATQDKEQK